MSGGSVILIAFGLRSATVRAETTCELTPARPTSSTAASARRKRSIKTLLTGISLTQIRLSFVPMRKAAVLFVLFGVAQAPQSLQMGGKKSVTRFFITSRGLGRGGDLGGLTGADAHCQAL